MSEMCVPVSLHVHSVVELVTAKVRRGKMLSKCRYPALSAQKEPLRLFSPLFVLYLSMDV